MNQEQVKKKLLELDSEVEDFKLTMTGKSSKKVDGLYKPDTREILLHNENFKDDNQLIFTAIHEFAHHIQFTKSSVPVYSRAHTSNFRQIFHRLLAKAEEKKIYINIFRVNEDFIRMTELIKRNFLIENGRLMIEFGKILVDAYGLCIKHGASFEDYLERTLGFSKPNASVLLKIQGMNMNPEVGFDNMKTMARIKDPEEREAAQNALIEGESPEIVKADYVKSRSVNRENKLDNLIEEKLKIQKHIENLHVKLAQLELKIEEIERMSK
jgi:hypothetical protein